VIQLNRFPVFFLTLLLAVLVGCAPTSKKEGTGEYIDDTLLTTKVKAAVFNEPSLKSSEINVETFKGVVQLSGFVRSEADIKKAVEVAQGVKGVNSVKNDMRVK
jgi:osmotically-inducible protein OsmY